MNKNSERLLDSLIKYASHELVKEMANEYPNEKDLHGKYSYSSKFKKNVEKLISNSRQINKTKQRSIFITNLFSTFKKVIIATCILASTFLIVAFAVPPIRIAIMNFYIEKHEDYYAFRKQNSDEISPSDDTSDFNDIVPYVPKDFVAKDVLSSGPNVNITLVSDNDIIHFERTVGEGSIFVDAEDVEYNVLHIEEVEIHTFTKNGMNTLIFSRDQYSYLLSSEFDIDELIRMAVEIINK